MLTNTAEFRKEAQHFLKYGFYTGDPQGSAPYFEYWTEQLKRCKEGYKVGDTWITGHHYFYLNFCQIRLTDNIKKGEATRKVTTFPGFWDGDYEFFLAMETAAKAGKHMIVSKARRKGFSYKNAAIAANIYNTQKDSYTLLCAHDKKYLYPKGIMTMTTNNLNFLNEHTAWSKRRQRVDQTKHVKSSYLESVGGQIIEKGYKSEVEAITFKDNPDAARGKDATFVIMEECGAFDNLKSSYLATRPCVEDGGITTGQMILFGTGGDMEGGTIDFESMFYNPEAYNLYPFDNVYDEGGVGQTCGFFFPSFQNKIGFMDNEGNSLVEKAKQEEQAKRDDLKANAKDAGVYDKYVTEYPWCPKEAFLQTNANMFPTVTLAEWRNELMRTGLDKRMSVHGRLLSTTKGVTFRVSEDARPLIKFPHQKGDDITGCVTIYQAPYKSPGTSEIPDDLYIIVHDPYAHEGGASLGAAYVLKRMNRLSKPDDMIVASYVGRPDSQDTYNENLFLLAEYYNARIGFENDRGEVIPYAKRSKKLHMLLHEAEIFSKKENINIKALGRNYGVSMGSKQRKDQAEIYLRDWLKTTRGTTESGEKRLNLHYIYDIALLDELIKYSRDGNFDRVSALLVGMLHLQDLHDREVEEAEVITESNNFWSRDFF